MVNVESTIVTTCLVVITNDLHGFEKASWIISSYILGYVGRYHLGRKYVISLITRGL
jgi:hypothetical protein